MLNGYGTEIKIGDYKYIGNFRNRMKNGKGEIIWDNGQSYLGNWKDGKFDGEGILKTN